MSEVIESIKRVVDNPYLLIEVSKEENSRVDIMLTPNPNTDFSAPISIEVLHELKEDVDLAILLFQEMV